MSTSNLYHSVRLSAVLCLCALIWFLGLPTGDGVKRYGARQRRQESSEDEAPANEPASSSGAPERRGGLRQRRTQAAEDAEPDAGQPPLDTPFIDNLKKRWGKGELSSAAVQDLAADAARQGAHSLDRMARAGTYGTQPKNLFRDLLALFGKPKGAPPIDWVGLPMQGGTRPRPVIWPTIFLRSFEGAPRPMGCSDYRGSRRMLGVLERYARDTICSEPPFPPRGGVVQHGAHWDAWRRRGLQQGRLRHIPLLEFACRFGDDNANPLPFYSDYQK